MVPVAPGEGIDRVDLVWRDGQSALHAADGTLVPVVRLA